MDYSKHLILLHFNQQNEIKRLFFDLNVDTEYFMEKPIEVDEVLNRERDKINHKDYMFLVVFPFVNKANSRRLLKSIISYFLYHGVTNYKVLSDDDIDYLYKKVFSDCLKKKNISIDKELIEIGKFRFPNYIKTGDPFHFIDYGDLILSSFYQDYTMAGEGAYEYAGAKLDKGDIVIDCGAFSGGFTAYALSRGCKVYAFEPFVETYNRLCENLKLYKNENVHVINNGLADKIGLRNMYKKKDNSSNSFVIEEEAITTVTCEVTTIDVFVQENKLSRVDFIKADIEGAERLMLIGARETIKKYNPKLSICTYHMEDDPQVLEDIILGICSRYKIVHKWGKLYATVSDIDN